MGRKSALEENGYKEGSKSYNYWIDEMDKLVGDVNSIRYKNLTEAKCYRIIRRLNEFAEADFNFTIGYLDYRKLYSFLVASLDVLDLGFIAKTINSYTSMMEINPISYGYKNDDINLLIASVEDISRKINNKNK